MTDWVRALEGGDRFETHVEIDYLFLIIANNLTLYVYMQYMFSMFVLISVPHCFDYYDCVVS